MLETFKADGDSDDGDNDDGNDDDGNDDDGGIALAAASKRSRSFDRVDRAIVLGVLKAGRASVGEILLFGPTREGRFLSVRVESVHINRCPVRSATAGQCATLLIRSVGAEPEPCSEPVCAPTSEGLRELPVEGPGEEEDDWTVADEGALEGVWARRTGMVLLASNALRRPAACWEFLAELLVLNHPSAIRLNYEPVVHAENVMQSARLKRITAVGGEEGAPLEALRVGDKGRCVFRFLYRPEYMLAGAAVVIREGRTRGVGRVLAVLPW